MRRSLWIALALVGCKSEPVPTCEQVMKHLQTVMSDSLRGKSDVAECEGRKLTDDKKRCLFATKTMDDVAACQAGRAPEEAPLPTGASGAPPSKHH